MKFVLGLGTNIGNRMQNLRDACRALNLLPETEVLRHSQVYETKPYGFTEQDDFLNMAVEIDSALPPESVLGACLGIEAALWRIRTMKNGPRIVDLDVLLAEGFTSNTAHLRIPHPEICNRSFVLQPLMDLYGTGCAFGFDFSNAYHTHKKDDIWHYRKESF